MRDNNPERPQEGRRHRWLALACCGPILLVLGILIITDVIGLGSALLGVACIGVMAAAMLAMESMENH